MKTILRKAMNGEILSEAEIEIVLAEFMSGRVVAEQAAALLGAIASRGETSKEIANFATIMKSKSKPIELKSPTGVIDVCGTGGDGAKTFNISTAVAFVVAGAGAKVVKHGNRSVSSKSGIADVLEELGVSVDVPAEKLQGILDEANMVFLFAPNYHPSMKHIKSIRESIGVPTIFNLLGPLVNPVGLNYQIVGVYDLDKCEKVANALKEMGIQEAMVVHGQGGLDEVSTVGETIIYHLKNGEIKKSTLVPENVGIQRAIFDDLQGGDAKENAQIILEILQGNKGSKRDVVVLNAAAALIVSGIAEDFEDGINKAAISIDSGAALKVLEKLKNVS